MPVLIQLNPSAISFLILDQNEVMMRLEFRDCFWKLNLLITLSLVGAHAHAGNLLSNPKFETDISGWAEPNPDADITVSHDTSHDSDDTPGIVGSLKVELSTDNFGRRGPSQCVQVDPETTYDVAGAIYRETQSPIPYPELGVYLYSGSACELVSFQDFAEEGIYYLPEDVFDTWYDVGFQITTLAGTRSAHLRLFSGGIDDPTVTTVYFDNVFLPEPGSVLSTVAAAAVLCGLGWLRKPRPARRYTGR